MVNNLRKELIRENLEKIEARALLRRKIIDFVITVSALTAIVGFSFSVLFLIALTGGVIGPTRYNLYGIIFVIIFLLIWTLAVFLWHGRNREEKKIEIKALLRESETEV